MKQQLVLVPGLGADAAVWEEQCAYLEDLADVIVPDLSQCLSRAEMTQAVLAAVTGRFALAGHSMGGWVAQEVAANEPQRVSRLALVATWARPDPDFNAVQRQTIEQIERGGFEQELAEHIDRILSPAHRGDTALVARIQEVARRAGPAVFIRHIRAMLQDYDSRACLPAIRCPTMVVGGRDDPIFPVAEQEFLAATVPGAWLAIVEDCGHVVMWEQPQMLAALLRFWLNG